MELVRINTLNKKRRYFSCDGPYNGDAGAIYLGTSYAARSKVINDYWMGASGNIFGHDEHGEITSLSKTNLWRDVLEQLRDKALMQRRMADSIEAMRGVE